MNVPTSSPIAYLALTALTAGVFLIDLLNPLAMAEWLGYTLPLLVSAWFLRRRDIMGLTTVCSFLIVLAFFLNPYNNEPKSAIISRFLGIVVIWVVALLLMKRKQAEDEIRQLNAELRCRAAELAAANVDLAQLNLTLEERVREEVQQNRDKDYQLILKSRQAAMGEMISNIAHQWRQPLIALELFVRDVKACHESGQFTAEYLDGFVARSIRAIRQMSQTIDDFMNFLKPNKAKVRFNPREMVDKALSFMEWGARRPAVTVECAEPEDLLVNGYPNEYVQALLNLLQNARDILAERDIASPRIRIRMFREGERSVVTVADNGGGIAADVMGKVFEPYFTTKDEGKGSGIGLYMSRMIIERNMGGTLTVRNAGDGAEFRIEV